MKHIEFFNGLLSVLDENLAGTHTRLTEAEAREVVRVLSSQLTSHAADLPRACAAGNHYTNDVGRGRDFSFCPDCGKPLM